MTIDVSPEDFLAFEEDYATKPVSLVKARRPREPRLAVLIPAHNEEALIYETVRSIFAQSKPPARVIVMSDNSTDRTVELAKDAGAEVHETVDNTGRKAGALNIGFNMVLPTLTDDDFVMTMDADGRLAEDCAEVAMEIFAARPELGGLSGSVLTREIHGWLELAQAIEYERGRRLMARKGGKIHVLSGAAAFFKVSVLKEVAAQRGKLLPGIPNEIFMESNIVEDYELTLAVKTLGYKVTSSKRCKVITDLMPTIPDLEQQRLRWYRGTVDTLRDLYPLKKHTRITVLSIVFNMLSSMLLPLAVVSLVFSYLQWHLNPDWRFAMLAPLFVAENVICARRMRNWKAVVMALSFFPLWLYDNIQFAIYWRSVYHSFMRKPAKWAGDAWQVEPIQQEQDPEGAPCSEPQRLEPARRVRWRWPLAAFTLFGLRSS